MSDVQTYSVAIPQDLAQYWGWFLAFGIALVALGVAAVARAFTATIASMLFFGWLLVIASGVEIAQAVMVGHWAGFFHHLLAAILFGVVGLLLVTRPLISAEAVTFVIGVFFLIGGLFQLIGSFAVSYQRPCRVTHWGFPRREFSDSLWVGGFGHASSGEIAGRLFG